MLRLGLITLVRYRPDAVFTHMADVHAAILSPWIRLLKIRHVFWYAHAHNSRYLKFSRRFVSVLVSSTSGSIPHSSKRVLLIGQSIDTTQFIYEARNFKPNGRYLHVGRFDQSKQIGLICETYLNRFSSDENSDLSFIGSSANPKSEEYRERIFARYSNEIRNRKIKFLDSVSRESLPKIYRKYDVFIHAYVGSLDKTLLEATAVGLPVVTINPEYNSEFGTWSNADSKSISLAQELLSLSNKSHAEITEELHRRASLVEKSHSQHQWISKLVKVLLNL